MNELTLTGEIQEFTIFFHEGSTMYLRMGRYSEPKYWRKLCETLIRQGIEPGEELTDDQKETIRNLLIAHRAP